MAKKRVRSRKRLLFKPADVKQGIKKILADVARVSESDIKDNINIRDDLGIDSLNAMEILAAIETKHKITIDEAKVFDIITVKDLNEVVADYLKRKKLYEKYPNYGLNRTFGLERC